MENKCICKNIIERTFGHRPANIYIHLMGCPESSYSKEYYKKKWYQRLFDTKPEHFIREVN